MSEIKVIITSQIKGELICIESVRCTENIQLLFFPKNLLNIILENPSGFENGSIKRAQKILKVLEKMRSS